MSSPCIVLDAQTRPVSISSTTPQSVPDGHSKVAISKADYDAVIRGDKRVVDGGGLVDTGRAREAAAEQTLQDRARQLLGDIPALRVELAKIANKPVLTNDDQKRVAAAADKALAIDEVMVRLTLRILDGI